ncbi:MAG TPA: aspartyl-phosphate phosphatase Spo0E family protein [Clostridiaceae bacterium]|nr:aspartyl-phosphate phosphatase Spo0E family protein [Clostridiaceae bacterium]
MSQKTICARIAEMHNQLNQLIESSNYDLLDDKVQRFSRELDKLIILYSQTQADVNKTSFLHIK